MGTPRFHIDIKDIDGLLPVIKNLLGVDTSSIMQAVSLRMRAMQRQHFEMAVDSYGESWEPLSPWTINRRSQRMRGGRGRRGGRSIRNAGFGSIRYTGLIERYLPVTFRSVSSRFSRETQPLLDTGKMFNSISPAHTRSEAIAGTNDTRAPLHQYGGFNAQGKLVPQREFIYLNFEESEFLTNFVVDDLLGPLIIK